MLGVQYCCVVGEMHCKHTATVYRPRRKSQQLILKSLYCAGVFSDACLYDLTIVFA